MFDLLSWPQWTYWVKMNTSYLVEGARRTISHPPDWIYRMVGFLISMTIVSFIFQPFLKIFMRRPLRKYVCMEFDDVKLSIYNLSLKFTHIVILPVESLVLQGIFAALFPSAFVKKYDASDDYPTSKIAIETLRVRIRMRLNGSRGEHVGKSTPSNLWRRMRPMISVELRGVTLEVEKAYLAPPPPPEFSSEAQDSLPSAISPSDNVGPEIPVFDDGYLLDFLRGDESRDADIVTFLIERWIQHAKDAGNPAAKESSPRERTSDEKMNYRIRSAASVVLHSISIVLKDASLIISGAGSQVVKEARKRHGPRETNILLSKLPKNRRALTLIGTNVIAISFSPDDHGNLQLSLAGVHVKVGNPVGSAARETTEEEACFKEITYAWHTITEPFDFVLELKGVSFLLPFFVNYDHNWNSRPLAIHYTASEIVLSLLPEEIQTLLLHLDDWTDAMSSYNEWYIWLNKKQQLRLKSIQPNDREKRLYCHNYARMKGTVVDGATGNVEQLTALQMKEMDSRMTRHEILSLRCIAMKNGWKIPETNEEFAAFLDSSRSSICDKGNESCATSFDVLTPFQHLHLTPLHALMFLVREKNYLLSPGVTLIVSVKALQYSFPNEPIMATPREKSTVTMPSSLLLSHYSLNLKYANPLFPAVDSMKSDMLRPLLSVSTQVLEIEWRVTDSKCEDELGLSASLNKPPAGIRCQTQSSPVFRAEFEMAVSPTKHQDPLITLDLQSSDLVMILNPIPLVSALQTLIDIPQIPFSPPAEVNSDDSQDGNPILSSDIHVRVKDTSILLMCDRTDILRGILELSVDEFSIQLQSIGMAGEAVISVLPVSLSAGRPIQHPSSSANASISWTTQKLQAKPIILVDGVRLRISGKENNSQLDIAIQIGTDTLLLNVSPSALDALTGFSSSLEPLLEWAGGQAEEEERIRLEKETKLKNEQSSLHYRREALRALFISADADCSGLLSKQELERIILMLFADIELGNDASQNFNAAQHLTAVELNRERDYFMTTVDSINADTISYEDIDMILFRMAHGIDDNNLTPTIGVTEIDYLDKLAHSKAFLSAPAMRRLIHFDDLREYAASHEIYRITGCHKLENSWTFPAPIMWCQGEGIDLFWELYTRETGCDRNSLNGQNISSVQCKLVRSLCNYHFAKFCWKSIVQPQLHASYDDEQGRSDNTITRWLLDDNPQRKVDAGVFERLFRHVNRVSKDSREAEQKRSEQIDTRYNIQLALHVNRVTLGLGSPYDFTKSVFEVEFTKICVVSSALVSSQTGLAVLEKMSEEVVLQEELDNGQVESDMVNGIRFRSTLSVYYLNRKRDQMESFVESYPCFGYIAYKTLLRETVENDLGVSENTFIVNIICPRSLNINALPAFFGAASMFSQVISQSNFRPYSGCQEIQLENQVGKEFMIETDASDPPKIVPAYSTAAFSLGIRTSFSSLSFAIPGYNPIHVTVIPFYQSMMLPLIRHTKRAKAKRARKASASGFSPYLTIEPKLNRLDSVCLTVRPSVTIKTDIPIKVRIVRLGKAKSFGHLRKRGIASSQIDLSKKGLEAVLNRLVDGAIIVYEKDAAKGVDTPLPLPVLESSHLHALLVQDLTGRHDGQVWREPVLLSKDFLHNPTSIRQVSRCHAVSGIVVRKERLIFLPDKNRSKPVTSDANKIIRRTAWDTTIQVVPFFLLSNSMPFPILARVWQLFVPKKDDDAMWRDSSLLAAQLNDVSDDCSSSDEDSSVATPSIKGWSGPDKFHHPNPNGIGAHRSYLSVIRTGETIRLSGINLQQHLYVQFSQKLQLSGEADETMWSNPLQLELGKLRTGVNPRGWFNLPKLFLNFGDSCSAVVDVALEGAIRVPICTIYSPYWIQNKTGSKLGYKIIASGLSKRYFVDSGSGGLPVMLHCGNSDQEISVIPLECPRKDITERWWDSDCNGKLVWKQQAIRSDIRHPCWSENIELEQVGTSVEIQSHDMTFSVHIASLAGEFYRSKLITLLPRYVLKNMLHIGVTILPVCGGKSDVLRKARQLRQGLSEQDDKMKVYLRPNESTILYNFTTTIKAHRWVAFCVDSARQVDDYKCKWHLIPLSKLGSTSFGEHDGLNDTLCGIVESKLQITDGARIVSIIHASLPPFRIENRSNDHVIQFVQDDDDAVVFELPPMHSCGYCWDSPQGRKSLRAVVFPNDVDSEAAEVKYYRHDRNNDSNANSDSRNEECVREDHSNDLPSWDCGSSSIITTNTSKASRKSFHITSERRLLFGAMSRGYNLSKFGNKKNLPSAYSSLKVHLRISAGTKILTFNDSSWLTDQAELGLLKKGGGFKSTMCDIRLNGFAIYLMDDYPREVIGIIMRDLHIYKPMGSIETSVKVRHFQVDAMIPDARYPIIVQPKMTGVDAHGRTAAAQHEMKQHINEKDCFWLKRHEKLPVLELNFSYVPQTNMTWIPHIDVIVCPMKVQLDVDYIVRIVGTIMNSIGKYEEGASSNCSVTTHANDKLHFITHGHHEYSQTYIERLFIAPVYFEMEINLKPDEENETAQETDLTLSSIARSSNSANVAAILSWVINVGVNFAHVSPTFRYGMIIATDKYCDVTEFASDIILSYIFQTVRQSYKVVFSLNLLGDPNLLAHQWRTGITDLVYTTRNELRAGGKDGFGKGIASFAENVVGGTFLFANKLSGGVAKTIDAVITTPQSSAHLKPKLDANQRRRPRHAIEGFVQGGDFLTRTVVHGVAGVIGNPIRGAKAGLSAVDSVAGAAKGLASGAIGLIASPFIGALGFVSKTSDGIAASTRYLELGAVEARCRPARMVSWGAPMLESGLSFLKAIGIRVHTVSYQKIRKQIDGTQNDKDSNNDGIDFSHVSSKEFKRLRAAETRRKFPPRKVVEVLYQKYNMEKRYVTARTRPELLKDERSNGARPSDRYAVCFEDTIILEASNLQLTDEVVIQFRNSKLGRRIIASSKPSGLCRFTIGDMYSSILHFYREQLKDLETNLAEHITNESNGTLTTNLTSKNASDIGANKKSLTIPAPQDFPLFRPAKAKLFTGDVFDAIREEMESIKEADEMAKDRLGSSYAPSDSEDSFLLDGEDTESIMLNESNSPSSNERLFGNISLSFFPVLW